MVAVTTPRSSATARRRSASGRSTGATAPTPGTRIADTFDKVIFADLKHNATLYAMLAYMASEEEDRLPRDRRTEFPADPDTGEAGSWPECQPARRSWSERR